MDFFHVKQPLSYWVKLMFPLMSKTVSISSSSLDAAMKTFARFPIYLVYNLLRFTFAVLCIKHNCGMDKAANPGFKTDLGHCLTSGFF